MSLRLSLVSLLVPDYDAAIAFYVGTLGFLLLEDTDRGYGKRWVRVGPEPNGTAFLLAKAIGDRQQAAIGRQGGGRVWLFLETDDFAKDYARLQTNDVPFEEAPRHETYGTVAVFSDPFGNRWDLSEYAG